MDGAIGMMPDTFELQVQSIAFGGTGVGNRDGTTCLVPGTASGEIVRVSAHQEGGSVVKCWLTEVVQPAPERVEPACPLAVHLPGRGPLCQGCNYQHLNSDAELDTKQRQFAEMLAQQAGIGPELMEAPIPSPRNLHYRNKLVFHAQRDGGQTTLGYFMEDNATVLDVPDCPLAHEEICREYAGRRQEPGFFHTLRDGMNVTFRYTEPNGVVLWRNQPSPKESWLREDTPFGLMSVPRGGFFQVNTGCARQLMEKIADLLHEQEPERVLDLYCGAGVFSVVAAIVGIPQIIGIDNDAATVKTAEYNLREHPNARFLTGDARKLISGICSDKLPSTTVMLVDPPRRGLDASVTHAITRSSLQHLIYVSCGPDTLCRDLKRLGKGGFEVVGTQLFDMFPKTAHFETVTVLSRDA